MQYLHSLSLKKRRPSFLFALQMTAIGMCLVLQMPASAMDTIANSNPPSASPIALEKNTPPPYRLHLVTTAHVIGYTGTLLMLNELWYKDHPRSSFHFFNDSGHWKQMDKAGHTVTAFHFSKLSYRTFRWAGLDNKQATLWGSISGSAFLTTIELLDGFSREWGASWADIGANTFGALSFMMQQYWWQEQKILWKYSFSPSNLSQYRPGLLGSTFAENLIKDYNGQTFWLSFNLRSLLGAKNSLPPWLNVALGYGAMGMLGSSQNPASHNGRPLPVHNRYRQFYLAPDIDFSRIPTRSPTLQQILTTLNFIKFPAPALEYNSEHGWVLHWVFF
ncbi:MAG: DUF2279 domain-containing protein [Bacteroidota bacterium]